MVVLSKINLLNETESLLNSQESNNQTAFLATEFLAEINAHYAAAAAETAKHPRTVKDCDLLKYFISVMVKRRSAVFLLRTAQLLTHFLYVSEKSFSPNAVSPVQNPNCPPKGASLLLSALIKDKLRHEDLHFVSQLRMALPRGCVPSSDKNCDSGRDAPFCADLQCHRTTKETLALKHTCIAQTTRWTLSAKSLGSTNNFQGFGQMIFITIQNLGEDVIVKGEEIKT